MKTTPAVLAIGALALAAAWAAGLAATAVTAVGGDEKPRIAQLDFGTHWYGAEADVNTVKGKVVLVELWGS